MNDLIDFRKQWKGNKCNMIVRDVRCFTRANINDIISNASTSTSSSWKKDMEKIVREY